MSAVIVNAAFGNPQAIRSAEAANAARLRALKLGYGNVSAQQFARIARREASQWESPNQTAMRVVIPRRGTFAGPTGGSAA